MKRVKLIITIMMFSVLIIGVAYANWESAFMVTTTVSSGNLDIKVTAGDITHPRYMTTSIKNESNSNILVLNLEKFYPRAYVDFDFKVENTGTLGVLLDDIVLSHEDETSDELDQYFEFEYSLDGSSFVSRERIIEILGDVELGLLDSNNYSSIHVRVHFDPDNKIETDDMEGESITYILTITYKQFNVLN